MKIFSKKIIAALAISGTAIFGGIFYTPPVSAEPITSANFDLQQQGGINWGKDADSDVIAVGISLKDSRGLAMAREAAILAAQRDLVGFVQGMRISSETSMQDLRIQSDVVNRKIEGTLRGARLIEEKETAEGGYYVKLRVPIYGVGGIAAAVVPEIKPETPKVFEKIDVESTPVDKVVQREVRHANYTGIVIDTTGLGLEPTFSPVIYDTNGRAVYGIDNLQTDTVINIGMVGYSDSVQGDVVSSRAGTNPLVIKAVAVSGGNNSANKVNAVISVEDADKILLANETAHVLENCAVVFVK